MNTITFGNKTYSTNTEDYLTDFNDWDEDFARGMAPKTGILAGLTEDHWKIIHYIRNTLKKTGKCPLVYETCRVNRLHIQELKRLFPAGYLRGACKLAGVSYVEGYLDQSWSQELAEKITAGVQEKSYTINIRGFLVNPSEWDEKFAVYKAWEMKMPKLTDRHWQIIHFLRKRYNEQNFVPTVYETCEENGMEVEELEKLFPDGYHRGAVKVAGLRVR
jgi:TusE/DsrC/DsvC family sulfur relay protein